jgi:hypothetical protein
MNDIQELASYLERITGHPEVLRRIAGQRLGGLPAFLTTAYRFYEWNWLDRTLILALTVPGAESASSGDLRAHHEVLTRHLACPVAFVFQALNAYGRNRLVHLGVPFIVPGLQLFIPPFASLCEQFQRTARTAKLSAAAQVTVLYQLFRHPPAAAMLNQWAEWLGYSAMTMTKVRDQLAANALCAREVGAKPRGLRFAHQGRVLWDAALPFLCSPIRRACWTQFPKKPQPALLSSGLTALAKRTMIEDDSIPTYACRDTEWKRLAEASNVRALDHPDEASARVECWRYAPELLAEDATVDRLSLFLSLSDSTDERVRLASQSLLEGMPW